MMAKPVSMLLSVMVLTTALLTGCSGSNTQMTAAGSNQMSSASGRTAVAPAGGVDKFSPPAIPPAPVKDTRPLIVAFGDSLTAGYGTNANESYPDYLQRDLDERGYQYRVINEGISGNTSKDGVLRVQEVVALHPAVVIVAFGGNDGLRGNPIADTEMNLSTIISALQDAHAKIVLGGITLPPNYGHEYIAKFNAMYSQLARTYHVPLLPFMLRDVYGTPGDMQNDGIYATAKGNQQVAKNFLPLLLPLLKGPSPKRGN